MTLHLWPEQIPLMDAPAVEAPARPPASDSHDATHIPQAIAGIEVDQADGLSPAVTRPLPAVEGGWGTVMADPPWSFRSWVANANPDSDRSADRHYRTMTLEEIAALPVRSIAAPDAHLFLWTTAPFLLKAQEIGRAWGFKYSSTGFVWMKLKRSVGKAQLQLISIAELPKFLHVGMGHTTRKNVEFCLLFRRGNARRLGKHVQEAIIAPVREHSRKPDEAYERALEYAAGPFLELFSREDRGGWTTWGNETRKFNGQD